MTTLPLRNSEVLGAQLDEFHGLDTDKPVWRIKSARMKVKERDQIRMGWLSSHNTRYLLNAYGYKVLS